MGGTAATEFLALHFDGKYAILTENCTHMVSLQSKRQFRILFVSIGASKIPMLMDFNYKQKRPKKARPSGAHAHSPLPNGAAPTLP